LTLAAGLALAGFAGDGETPDAPVGQPTPAEREFELGLAELRSDGVLGPQTAEWAGASPTTLRKIVEAVGRPLGSAAERFAERLAARPDKIGRDFAIDILARLPPRRGAQLLSAPLVANDPLAANVASRALDALAFVPDPIAIDAIALHLRAPEPATAANASRAAASLGSQLLAEARVAEAIAAYDAFCAADPGAEDLVLAAAIAIGVYADVPDPERAIALLRDDEHLRYGVFSAVAADRAAAHAMIEFFAGDSAAARNRLAVAGDALRATPPNLIRPATTRVRIGLDLAIVALCGESRDVSTARQAIRAAIAAAPHDDDFFMFDAALFGPAGPRSWLERLRRTGRSAARRDFYAVLSEELDAVAANYSNDDEQPARTWLPIWRAHALLDDGRLDEVLALTTALESELATATAWNDRWMRAEAELLAGIATHLRGDPAAALQSLTSALRRVTELAGEEIDYIAEEYRDVAPAPGAPPLRGSLRSVEARAARACAEACLAAGRDREALAHAAVAADADPFSDSAIALELALLVRAQREPERAARALESFPREAGALLELSRLAFALGRDEEGEALFRQHLAWNALTDERRAAEARRRDLDRTLRPE
jgi:hypothetical protein